LEPGKAAHAQIQRCSKGEFWAIFNGIICVSLFKIGAILSGDLLTLFRIKWWKYWMPFIFSRLVKYEGKTHFFGLARTHQVAKFNSLENVQIFTAFSFLVLRMSGK